MKKLRYINILGFILLLNMIVSAAGIGSVSTNKSRYDVDSTVIFTLNVDEYTDGMNLNVSYYQLNKVIKTEVHSLTGNEYTWNWQPASEDYTGYMVNIELLSNGSKVDDATIAVDVSSSWDKYPRYGFLSSFAPTHPDSIKKTLAKLNRFHINGLQFYDWHYKHHKPLKGTGENPEITWTDIANRTVYLYTVRNYISGAHELNMKAMAYNLIYGAFDDAEADGVSNEWRLFTDSNHNTPDIHDLPSGWVSDIYLMDPQNTLWQDYIINQTKEAFIALDFDGWHIDQLGDRGNRYNYNGGFVNVPTGFKSIVNKAKETLNCNLVMNAVGQYAQQDIAETPVDFLYSEVWEPNTTYEKLGQIINFNNNYGNEKGLRSVLAAYIHKELSGSSGSFNPSAVLYADAVIFAFGGAHLELGEHMLCNEYFPNNNLSVSGELEDQLINYYDFMVAYQNLLRDDSQIISEQLSSTQIEIIPWARQFKVWNLAKQMGDKKIFHLINFADASTLDWRDNNKTQTPPEEKTNIPVTFESDDPVYSVWFASPDYMNGVAQNLEFTQSEGVVSFVLPSLKYWDMVVLDYNPATDIEDEQNIPEDYGLMQNYPNPFNPSTKIEYYLPKSQNIKIIVYNVLGKEVATLVNGYQKAGYNTVSFNASGLSSGVYVYQLVAENFTSQRKMLLIK